MQVGKLPLLWAIAGALYPLETYCQECTVIERAGYVVNTPGIYCFESDIFTRTDFADHPAESAIVEIRSSDVTIDMKGHRGGRARLPFQNGGTGIAIVNVSFAKEKYRNIVIKNGIISDFASGVFYFYASRNFESQPKNVEKVAEGYIYRPANIRIINVRFKNCKDDVNVLDAS